MSKPLVFAVVLVLAAALTTWACTLLVPLDEVQCSSAQDCRARGPAFASARCVANVCQAGVDGGSLGEGGDPWACLTEPSLPTDPAEQVNVQLVLYNSIDPFTAAGSVDGGADLTLSNYVPLTGVSVAACSPLDPTCALPLGPVLTSDDAGIVHLGMPESFSGFYYLQRADSLPTLFYTGRLLAGTRDIAFASTVTSRQSVSELGAALGITANQDPDGGTGVVSVTAFDCNDRFAAGVSMSSNAKAQAMLYLQNHLPSTAAKETDSEGIAVFVNVAQGTISVSAALVAQGHRPIGTVNVLVRPAAITEVFLRPRTH
jgi:hypothetical protein